MVVYAELSEQGSVLDLLDLAVEGLPLVQAFRLHHLVLTGGGNDLPVGVAAVEGIQRVVLRSQLLRLVPGGVAVGDESCASLFAGLLRGTALGLHV